MSEIRVVVEDEYPELIRIVGEAYPGEGLTTRAEREKRVERFKKSLEDADWTPYGVFRDSRMVGVFRNFDFSLNVRGQQLSAGGLGMVAVDLPYKKQHVAKEIVESFLGHYDEREFPMTMLWPFRVDFYHNMGFGLGSRMFQYRVKPASLPRGRMDNVRYLSKDDIPALTDCYNRRAGNQNGMVKHQEYLWKYWFEYAETSRFVGCETDGRLEGFFIYHFKKPERPTSFMDSELVVSRLVYNTPAALAELMTFVHCQLDQCDRVTLEVPEDEFYYLLSDPTLGTGGKMAPTYHESHMSGIGIMYRVMNIKRLFEQLAEPCFGRDDLSVKITLHDTFFPKNDGSSIVQFRGGRGTVSRDGEAEIEITMDVSEFSSMIMGAVGLGKLVTYGLARISDASYLDRVDRLFAYHQKPVCMSGF